MTSETFMFRSFPTRCASRTRSARAAPISLSRPGRLVRLQEFVALRERARCRDWVLSVAILPERSCAGLSFKSLDQLPQRTAIRNVVEAIASQVHLPAQLGEGRLPNHARCRAQAFDSAERILQFHRHRAEHLRHPESRRDLHGRDRPRYGSCQAKSDLLTKGLHPCFERAGTERATLLVSVCPFVLV